MNEEEAKQGVGLVAGCLYLVFLIMLVCT